VKLRSRQYSLDERRYQVQNPYGPALVEAALGCVCILELSFLHKDPLCFFGLP
jgi:capsule polysaccharide modification protein KpsS